MRRLRDQLLADAARRYVTPTSIASLHAALGDKEPALQALEQGLALRDTRMAYLKDDPHWAPVKFETSLQRWSLPTLLIDSWFDAPLPGVCDDFVALRATGVPVGMRIGGGGHLDGGGEGGADAALAWFDRYAR